MTHEESTSLSNIHPGATLGGRYVLGDILEEDPRSTVFRATELAESRPVLVRVLWWDHHLRAQTPAISEQFRREMERVARLVHEDVVEVLDNGELPSGELYVVHEDVGGKTLAAILDSIGAIDAQDALTLMTQVLDALDAAHARGIVHRDLAPENIVVVGAGDERKAMITDIGVARYLPGVKGPKLVGRAMLEEAIAFPAYAAPERAQTDRVSPQADIYSWGLILVECLTGVSVVGGTTLAETIAQHESEDPHDIPRALAETPLGSVLRRAIHKQLDRRYRSVDEVRKALKDVPPAWGYKEITVITGEPPRPSAPRSSAISLRARPSWIPSLPR